MINDKYRHELKYLVSDAQIKVLENRIRNYMQVDEHAVDGSYNVRSIYFDDYNNTCFYQNENGTDPREKYRIRIYNCSKDIISLECKKKENNKTFKMICPLTYEQCLSVMKGIPLRNLEQLDPLLRVFTIKMMTDQFRPAVIVDYIRKPYIYQSGNVRVTFDTLISSSKQIERFFDPDLPKRPIMPIGMQLLEVKYDEYIPDSIYNNLQVEDLNRTAFSKYYLCRQFEAGGGYVTI